MICYALATREQGERQMELLSVNVGQSRAIDTGRGPVQTGIYKLPAGGPVQVTELGLAGDVIGNQEHHGGPDQAVYIYGRPDYAWWSAELGRDLAPGTFGENLTIGQLESALFSVGDRLRLGGAVLEVTAPRIPCAKLAARMGDPGFVKRFRQAERPGLYCRVIQPGPVQAGDAVRLAPYEGDTVTVLEMFRDFYEPQLDAERLRRYLAAPIAVRSRVEMQRQLLERVGQGT